ncbi:MAG: hypothetical protein ACTS2F_22895 [Thainema sp.]
MIINIPSSEEFKVTGISLLNLAWDHVSALYLDLKASNMAEWDDDGEVTSEIWQAAQKPLANALVLTQQGIEFLLKARISEISPFLLIDGTPRDWPGKCHEHDTAYSDFRTIDAQDLIRLHDTVQNRRLDVSFCQHVEELRKMRNAIMHSVDKRLRHAPSDLWKTILSVSHNLLGPQEWIVLRQNYLKNTPSYIAHGGEEEVMAQLSWECLQLLKILKPAEAREFLGVELKSRWYICNKCATELSGYDDFPKTAQLKPNEPTSTNLYCFVCNQENQVIRKDCIKEDCKGNVIHSEDNVCLTCYGAQA